MSIIPKEIDPQVKARAVRLATEYFQEYGSVTAALMAVAKQLGVGAESVRRWVVQARVDNKQRQGATGEESTEIK